VNINYLFVIARRVSGMFNICSCFCSIRSESMDDDIAGDEDIVRDVPAVRVAAKKSAGLFVVFLILSCDGGLWCRQVRPWDEDPDNDSRVVGCVRAQWKISTFSDHPGPDCAIFHAFAKAGIRCAVDAFVDYVVSDWILFNEPVPFDAGQPFEHVLNIAQHSLGRCLTTGRQRIFSAWVQFWGNIVVHTCKLAPNLVSRLFQRQLKCFHCVCVTAKTRHKLFLGSRPGKRILRAWKGFSVAASSRNKIVPLRTNAGFHLWSAIPVRRLIEWVEATKNVKDLVRHSYSTGRAFCKLLGAGDQTVAFNLLSRLQQLKTSTTVIREARVRIDAVACKLFREFFSTLIGKPLCIYIYIDSSPQWRGLDMLAVSFDLVCMHSGTSVKFQRRFPFVSLEHGQHDHFGKLIGLVWVIWLVVGPRYDAMRAFCNGVVSLLTDAGVERAIVDSVDVF
jgi:hypothetical protein